ncbi:hypothetical protein N8529_00800 [bacterium]|nr:hypothetical protein [bacterium]
MKPEAGYLAKGQAAATAACKMRHLPEIKAEVERLQSLAKSDAVMSAIELKEILTKMIKVAAANEDMTGLSQVTDRLAKMSGFYEPTKIESSTTVEVVIGGEDGEYSSRNTSSSRCC